MTALALAVLAAVGTTLVCTSSPARRTPIARRTATRRWRALGARVDERLRDAGVDHTDRREFVAVMVVLGAVGATAGWAIFGGALPALAVGGFAGSFPIASARVRAQSRRARALDAWPRMIEEMRVLTGAVGRSIPQALLDVGSRAPVELQPAFAAARREWLLSTDFARTVAVLKSGLADPTADMVCETLLVAHDLGGTDLDRRLAALAEDRTQDSQGRKDARSRQAGARFARRFVIFVPFGMALAGMSVGDGRAAYRSATGQVLVLVALAIIVGCWVWASRIMRLPDDARVFP